MKVLFPIGTIFPSQQGGPSNTVYWMAKALNTEGVEVTIISTNLGIDLNTIASNKWIDTNYGQVIYTSEWFHSLPLRLIFLSLKKLKEADIVHLTSIFYPPSWILAPIALLQGKKIIWSVRGNFEESALKIASWKKRPIIWLINQFLKKKTVFHTTSPLETQNTQNILGKDTLICEIPNYLELPSPILKNIDKKYFLYVGRLHPIKAIDNLIEALALSNKFLKSEFVLSIVGDNDSDYARSLLDLTTKLNLSDKVQFLGHLENDEKQEIYAHAYFSFLMSHSENFGNVVIESLAQGTPVVASQGTPWQILEKQNAGFWIDNSPQSIAATIDKILSIDIQDYKSMVNNAQELAREQFDINKNIGKWIDIYSKILKNDDKKFN